MKETYVSRDENPPVIKALAKVMKGIDGVEYSVGNILELWRETDAIVSPANSNGDMDGGLDLYIRDFFDSASSRRLQYRVYEMLARKYHEFLPVGQAEIMEGEENAFAYLIIAPTMQNASDISGTDNVYLAMKAVITAAKAHNKTNDKKIGKIAVSGLGTGWGKMDPRESARQIRKAFEESY